MEFIAKRGEVYLVRQDNKLYIVNTLSEEVQETKYSIDSILSRGYWEDCKRVPEVENILSSHVKGMKA